MDEEIYYVEEIRDREIRRGKFYYLIKWQGKSNSKIFTVLDSKFNYIKIL